MQDFTIRVSEQNINVHGISAPTGSGYTVLLNANDSEERRLAALLHEIIHIWHGDHYAADDLQEIEAHRRQELLSFLQAENES